MLGLQHVCVAMVMKGVGHYPEVWQQLFLPLLSAEIFVLLPTLCVLVAAAADISVLPTLCVLVAAAVATDSCCSAVLAPDIAVCRDTSHDPTH